MKRDKVLKGCLRQLEESLVRPEIGRSKDSVSRLLADDFLEFGSSGKISDKQQVIQDLQEEIRCQFSSQNFNIVALSPGAVLVTYHSTCTGALGRVKHSLRSSIWTRQTGEWRLVFHQGTPC